MAKRLCLARKRICPLSRIPTDDDSLMSTLPRVSLSPTPGDTLCVAVKLHRDATERNMCLNAPWRYQLIVHLVVLLRAQLRYQPDELLSSSPRIHNPTRRRYLVRVGRGSVSAKSFAP